MPREIHGSRRPTARLNDQPLSAGEQDVLDNFLLAECLDGDLVSFMALDGFITAVVVGPGVQMPATWHRNIFGGGADEEVLTRLAAAEEEGILGRTGTSAPTAHWRTVRRRAFATGRWTLPDHGEDTCLREVDWAEGFSEGILMSDEAWEGQLSWARCDELLAPVQRIAALPLTAPPAPGALLPALSEEEHLALGEELVGAVGQFYLGVRGRRSA